MRSASITPLAAALLALLGAARPVAGQRLVEDWLVRTGAGPGALQAGASAAFWNPAAIPQERTRGSLMVLELLAPEATGVDVLALAGSWRLDERTTLAVGIQHFEVGDVNYTDTSPDGGTAIDLSQDLFAIGATRQVGSGVELGAGAHYLRSSEALGGGDQLAIGAGARLLIPLALPVTVAGYAYSVDDGLVWGAGAELAAPLPETAWRAALNLGANGGGALAGTSYRAGATVRWRGTAELGAGLVAEPDAADRQWEPVLSGLVRLDRYELGVVREWLPNNFGTVHTFRFGIAF